MCNAIRLFSIIQENPFRDGRCGPKANLPYPVIHNFPEIFFRVTSADIHSAVLGIHTRRPGARVLTPNGPNSRYVGFAACYPIVA